MQDLLRISIWIIFALDTLSNTVAVLFRSIFPLFVIFPIQGCSLFQRPEYAFNYLVWIRSVRSGSPGTSRSASFLLFFCKMGEELQVAPRNFTGGVRDFRISLDVLRSWIVDTIAKAMLYHFENVAILLEFFSKLVE